MIKKAVGGGVRELASGLSDVEVCAPYYNCASLVHGFYSEVGIGTEGAEVSCKKAIPYSQFLRFHCICSQDEAFHFRTSQMSSFFKDRNFPSTVVEN
eukprot:g11968.t1